MNKTLNPFGRVVSSVLKVQKKRLSKLKTGLDIGCAYGANSRYLASLGLKMDAIDKALPRDIKPERNVSFQSIDVLDLPFDKTYDVILASHILHFLTPEDRANIMEKMYSSLNQGGYLFITSFTTDDEGVKQGKYKSHFATNELRNWAEGKGLAIKSYQEKTKKDNHEPDGEHKHEVVVLVGVKERAHLLHKSMKKATTEALTTLANNDKVSIRKQSPER